MMEATLAIEQAVSLPTLTVPSFTALRAQESQKYHRGSPATLLTVMKDCSLSLLKGDVCGCAANSHDKVIRPTSL
jgi:hypothetical protein